MKQLTRRRFIGNHLAAAAAGALAVSSGAPARAEGPAPKQKIKIGLIGCGGRANWLMPLLQKHGGYELHAVADYFQEEADKTGASFKVDAARRFSGLSGYKRVLESGVEAVLIEDVPYFYPEQARDAVAAGCHVYMAKPIAVDVPGCLMVKAAGEAATAKKRCLLVDYQLPSDPAMVEIAKRVGEGALGRLAQVASFGLAWHAWPDPALTANIESRLRGQIWLSDTALSGDTIVSYDIHIIDGLLAVLGKTPVSACGISKTFRAKPNGDRTDVASALYEFDDGSVWNHLTQCLDNNFDLPTLSASLFGMSATAHIEYGGKVFIKGGEKHYVGEIGDVFTEGVERNIADFYRNIAEGHFENATVPRAVNGTLAAILGREAAARRQYLTMDALIRENKRLETNLKGMKD